VIGGILIDLIILQNVVMLYIPSASDPLVKFLVHDAFLGELIVQILLGRDLELSLS
jgi:hypothetical protein